MTLHLRKIRYTFAFLLLGFLLPLSVWAQNSMSFSVSPTIFDMNGNPGQNWQSTIRVINTNPYDLTLYTEVVNFRPKGETGTPSFETASPELDISANPSAWIGTEAEVTIPAERTIELPLRITIPENAQPGGHYAAILIGTRPPDGSDANQVRTSQIISTLLFLRVSGDVTEVAAVRSFRSVDYILERPETSFEVRIENKGNVYVQPQGEIRIKNMWGQERGVIPVNQTTLFGNVLSNSVRKFSFDWKGDWSMADIGRYTAEVTLSYGLEEKQFMHADTAFWVFPWKIILVLVIVIIGVIKLFTWAVKAYIRRMLEMSGIHTTELAQRGVKRSRVSVTAPFEAGMLDLRQRLDSSDSVRDWVEQALSFVRAYWKFFLVAVAFIICVILIIVYVRSALTPTREFEITTDAGTTVTSEQLEEQNATPEPAPASPADRNTSANGLILRVIDRTNQTGALEAVTQSLSKDGFTVTESLTETGSVEERTVIVFSPDVTDTALRLSKLLNNAPLSALPEDETATTSEITIYLGSDVAASPE